MSKRNFDEIGDEKLRYEAQQQEIEEDLAAEARVTGKTVYELLEELEEGRRGTMEAIAEVVKTK